MKAKNRKIVMNAFAKFLIILSFFIFAIGFSYDSNFNSESSSSKKKNKLTEEPASTVSITPSDGVDIVSNDNNQTNTPVADNGNNNNNNDNVINNDDGVVDNNKNTNSNNNASAKFEDKSLIEKNNQLRKEIEKKYHITIKYGAETEGYTVAQISTISIDNPSVINNSLIRLNNVLGLYPNGMFDEIRDGGIPLTILLVNKYVDYNITGVTDSSYSNATISLAVEYPIEESFYHESYHYIERFMFKKGASFNTWNSINPDYFSYGTIYNDLSYSNTFKEDTYFVNNYAQTDEREDRASTFEYMMASSKASCLNDGQAVWKKAMLMSRTIDAVFDTVSPNTTEYWERFLY